MISYLRCVWFIAKSFHEDTVTLSRMVRESGKSPQEVLEALMDDATEQTDVNTPIQ